MRRALLQWSAGVAWLAVAWALLTASFHVAWAMGATVGLAEDADPPGQGWSLVHDATVASGAVVIAAVALVLAIGVRGRLGLFAWMISRLVGLGLVVRGIAGLVALGWDEAAGTSAGAAAAWQVWFVLGGILLLGAGPRRRRVLTPPSARHHAAVGSHE